MTGENARRGSSPNGYAPAGPRVDPIERTSPTGDFAQPLNRDALLEAATGGTVEGDFRSPVDSGFATQGGVAVHEGGEADQVGKALAELGTAAGHEATGTQTYDQVSPAQSQQMAGLNTEGNVDGTVAPQKPTKAQLTEQATAMKADQIRAELKTRNVEIPSDAKKEDLIKLWVKAQG